MELESIYNTTTVLLYALVFAFIMVAPPLISTLIAAEKGRSINTWAFFYLVYAFIVPNVISTFIALGLSGLIQYTVVILVYPILSLAPVWHSTRLSKSPSMQATEIEQGLYLKSCVYCDALIERSDNICGSCGSRTSLSTVRDWRVWLFVVGVIIYLLSLSAATDEAVSEVQTYNMISPLFMLSRAFLYSTVFSSIGLIISGVMQLAAICAIAYSIGFISVTSRRLIKGNKVGSPIVLTYVALYVCGIHPTFFSDGIGENGEAVTLAFSVGWFLWILSYVMIILALHLLIKNESTHSSLSIT